MPWRGILALDPICKALEMTELRFAEERPVPGEWWAADSPDRRVPGVLTRSPAGQGRLRLEDILVHHPGGPFGSDPLRPVALIVGQVQASRSTVALINCFESSRDIAGERWPGPKSQSFTVEYTLISHVGGKTQTDPQEEPDPLIHGLWARLDVLDQWGHRGGFVVEGELEQGADGGYSTTLDLSWPSELTSETPVGTISLTVPPMPVISSSSDYGVETARRSYLDCRLDPPIELSKLEDRLLSPLRDFLAVATDSQPAYTQIDVTLGAERDNVAELWCMPGPIDADHAARLQSEG